MVRTPTMSILGWLIAPSRLLDQYAGDAAPAEIAGQRQPDRPGADDQNRNNVRAGLHV